MTELQVTISNLKEVCITAELVLEKLEKTQKDLETLAFCSRFIVTKDRVTPDSFVIGIPAPACNWVKLPGGFLGRAGYSKNDLRLIMLQIQTLLGESDDRTNTYSKSSSDCKK